MSVFGLSEDKSNNNQPADNFNPASDDRSDNNNGPSVPVYSDDKDEKESMGPAPHGSSPTFWSDSVASDDDQHADDTPVNAPVDDRTPVAEPAAGPSQNSATDDLYNLKKHALQDLAPLVNHLDQTPEERFKTTMMLIQASDNAALVKEAYEAANKIEDEKSRAQALLDVVNEINYFTHQPAADKNSED